MVVVDDRIAAAVESLTGERPLELQYASHPLRGGLESPAVSRLSVSYRGTTGRRRSISIVTKQLDEQTERERCVYEVLARTYAREISPRLLGSWRRPDSQVVLYLEAVPRVGGWPWRDTSAAEIVLGELARLHESTHSTSGSPVLSDWSYETELVRSAVETREALERYRSDPLLSGLTQGLPALRRLTAALPRLRAELLSFSRLPRTVIHGDVHPGNVLVRRRGAGHAVVFVDWARARIGSPLEDVSSWLQSLGYWEPEARRRHDTLFRRYLSVRRSSALLDSEIRGAYWLAGASNGMAGALRYHLAAAEHAGSTKRRHAAILAAADWLRIIRRADAFWS